MALVTAPLQRDVSASARHCRPCPGLNPGRMLREAGTVHIVKQFHPRREPRHRVRKQLAEAIFPKIIQVRDSRFQTPGLGGRLWSTGVSRGQTIECWGPVILRGGDCPVLCKMLDNIPGLCPLDARSSPQVVTTERVCRHGCMSLESKIVPLR